MAAGNEIVEDESYEETTNDPEDETEEDEDEAETEDPMDSLREKCEESPHCSKLKLDFSTCEERVNGKTKTSETCAQEVLDFLHCRDHCVSQSLFSKIK